MAKLKAVARVRPPGKRGTIYDALHALMIDHQIQGWEITSTGNWRVEITPGFWNEGGDEDAIEFLSRHTVPIATIQKACGEGLPRSHGWLRRAQRAGDLLIGTERAKVIPLRPQQGNLFDTPQQGALELSEARHPAGKRVKK